MKKIKYYVIGFSILTIFAGGSFFILSKNSVVEIFKNPSAESRPNGISEIDGEKNKNFDIEPQKPLDNPPETIKAVYFTGWSAGNEKKIDYLIDVAKKTEVNAVVIDIKDFSGYVAYDIQNADIEKYGAKEIKIPKINALLKKLHDEGIYAVARITVFQDPVLAKARPDLAIHSRLKLAADNQRLTINTLWLDHKKLAWIDPAAKEAWDYNIAIAKDASERGFDEINFDYIRFASDGNLDDMFFSYWNEKTSKRETISGFFKYLRGQLAGVRISADIFGIATIKKDDLGIGQIIEDAYEYFDYVSPMIYPSHYAKGFMGYKNPAAYPYEMVRYSMELALKRLKNATSTEAVESHNLNLKSKLRPWLQDFDLGAVYDKKMIRLQIDAVYDAASSTPESINGWMLWDPKNVYNIE